MPAEWRSSRDEEDTSDTRVCTFLPLGDDPVSVGASAIRKCDGWRERRRRRCDEKEKE